MPFAGTFNFRPSGTGDTPTGYYYDYFRCTGDGDTDEQRCNAGGYFLRAGSVSTTYMTADQACNNPLCPNDIETNEKLCCEFLHLERGWLARFRVWALDANNVSSNNPGIDYLDMGKTAPEQITDLRTTTVVGDGRHRSFNWTVPNLNGRDIQAYVLRRLDPTTNATQHDYWFHCDTAAGSSAVACTTAGNSNSAASSATCYPSGFSCTGTYTTDYNPVYAGGSVEVIVGSDIDNGDGSYLVPTQSYAWKVIAFNAQNYNCTFYLFDNCDQYLESERTGFSGSSGVVIPVQAVQENATPDKPTALQPVSNITQTSATFTWTSPQPNGADLTSYRLVCSDNLPTVPEDLTQVSGCCSKAQLDVLGDTVANYAKMSWKVSAWTEIKTVNSPPLLATDSLTVHNLTAGTKYLCVLSPANSVGGYNSAVKPAGNYRTDETVFDATFAEFNTLPDYPEPVPASSVSCTAIVDPVTNPGTSSVGTSGAPEGDAPRLSLQLTFDGARPMLSSRNTLGPEKFEIAGSALASSINVSGATDAFSLNYRRVTDVNGNMGRCYSENYDTIGQTSVRFNYLEKRDLGWLWYNLDDRTNRCATQCSKQSDCRAFEMYGFTSATAATLGSVDSNGWYIKCFGFLDGTYIDDPRARVITTTGTVKYPTGIQSNDYETNTGRRCFERRESKVQQRVLLPAAFEYNTEYTFLIKPWNTMAAAGEYGYNPDTWTPVTCSAVSFRPAAPTLQVVAAVDRYVKINWTEPNNHGLTIDQYQYSICRISSAYVTTCDNIKPTRWNHPASRYMCSGSPNSFASSSTCATGLRSGDVFTIDGLTSTNYYQGTVSTNHNSGSVGLRPGNNYLIVVRARNSAGLGWASEKVNVEMSQAPTSPTLTDRGPRQLSVTWSAYTAQMKVRQGSDLGGVGGVSTSYTTLKYRVRLYRGSVMSGGNVRSITTVSHETTDATVSSRSYTFADVGLTPGDLYWCDVQAQVDDGMNGTIWTGWSVVRAINTLADVPETPVAPSGSISSTSRSERFRLTNPFINGASVTQFILEVDPPSLDGANLTFNLGGCSGQTGQTCEKTIDGLTPGTDYRVRVSMRNSVGVSSPSPWTSFSTCEEEPSEMGAPTFDSHTTSSITLRWTPPGTNNGAVITNYRLVVRNNTAPEFSWTVETGLSTASLEVPNLTPGYGYQFSVQAYNGIMRAYDGSCTGGVAGDGWSPQSNWSTGSAPELYLYPITTPPRAPAPVTIVESQGKQMKISWSAPFANGAPLLWYTLYTNASSCGVMRVRLSPIQVWACSGPPVAASSATELTLYDLTPHTTYSYILSANNSAGESPYSDEVLQITDFHEPEQIVGFVDPPVRGDEYITVDWTKPTENGLPITRYEIKFRYQLGCSAGMPCVIDGFDYAGSIAQPGGSGWSLNDQICAWSNMTQECTTTSHTHSGLSPNRAYLYSVRAFNGYVPNTAAPFNFLDAPPSLDGWSEWSDWQTFYTSSDIPLTPPKPVPPPSVYNITSTAATLQWDVPSQQTLGITPAVNKYYLEVKVMLFQRVAHTAHTGLCVVCPRFTLLCSQLASSHDLKPPPLPASCPAVSTPPPSPPPPALFGLYRSPRLPTWWCLSRSSPASLPESRTSSTTLACSPRRTTQCVSPPGTRRAKGFTPTPFPLSPPRRSRGRPMRHKRPTSPTLLPSSYGLRRAPTART